MLHDPAAIEGDWLVARFQSSGRGRHGRAWASIPGNFFASTLVLIRADDPAASTLSLVAGLALFEAVEQVAPSAELALKWPNDLMSGGAKLAGVLLERQGDRVVVGTGVNLAGAPDLAERKVASLDGSVAPESFAQLLSGRFAEWLETWRRADAIAIREAWLSCAHPIGSALSVHGGPDQRVDGRFAGIEADGAMRLQREDGSIELIRAGDVQLG
jgi:BirA family biotin operon repressor/biotin-[acetyl-CoA-carboxylase] ligase